MQRLAHSDVLYLLVQLGLMLFFARAFGELAKKFKQPPVVGEILGGILLGPSLFALLLPGWYEQLFLAHPNASIAMDGLFNISLIMLLFISGMEIELPLIWRNGRSALSISFIGMIIPMILGTLLGWYGNEVIFGGSLDSRLAFSLFLGTALSITALPVIAKILLDLNLLNSKIGSLIIACAMMNDFVGWILFAIVLNLMPGVKPAGGAMEIWQTILLTIAFAVFTLTVVKVLVDRFLSFLNHKFTGTGSNMTIAMMMCFAGAIFTEYIGIHAIFGAFLMGIAFGESVNFSERSKEIIHQFVSNIFAPLFFVSIGLKVNFVQSFDLQIVLIILVVAFFSKIVGGYIGGRTGGLSHNESMGIGFGINARGAMEIILATIALQAALISEPVFVALTIMAILTSITSGHFLRLFVIKRK